MTHGMKPIRVGLEDGGTPLPNEQLDTHPEDFRETNKLGLYSEAAEKAREAKQERMPPDQWHKYLLGRGVKPDEIKWSGFDDAFQGQKSVGKHEVGAHFDANARDNYDETVKDNRFSDMDIQQLADKVVQNPELLKGHPEEEYLLANMETIKHGAGPNTAPGRLKVLQSDSLMNNFRRELIDLKEKHRTQYDDSAYLVPDENKTNYREVIVQHQPEREVFHARNHWNEPNPLFHVRMADTMSESPTKPAPNYIVFDNGTNRKLGWHDSPENAQKQIDGFDENKFGIPKNRLSFYRSQGKGAPQKTLHVEEIQSDWGQKGRQRGFTDRPDADMWRDVEEKHNELNRIQANNRKDLVDLWKSRSEGQSHFGDETYDRLLNSLTHQEIADSLGEDTGKEHKQAEQALADAQRVYAHSTPRAPHIEDTNKWTDLALKRILHEAAHGGHKAIMITDGEEQKNRWGNEEGLQHFYDTVVPSRLQKLINQHDPSIKVRHIAHDFTGSRGDTERVGVHHLQLTPKAIESIKQGQKLYKRGGDVEAPVAKSKNIRHNPAIIGHALNMVRSRPQDTNPPLSGKQGRLF